MTGDMWPSLAANWWITLGANHWITLAAIQWYSMGRELTLRQTLENNHTAFGLRRRPVTELLRLGQEQGAEPVARFEELLGHSWPEEEDVDEFIASTRRWRREGQDE